MLPNITLGFHVYNTCSSERVALTNVLSILTQRSEYVPNYKCNNKGTVGAFVGHLFSSLSHAIYLLLGIYRYSQISYGTQDTSFNDRKRFPTFYRTMISENTEFKVVIHLLKTFNWTWVGMLISDDTDRDERNERMKAQIINSGAACIAFFLVVKEKDLSLLHGATQTIKRSTANVILLDIKIMHFICIVLADNYDRNIIWISLSSMSTVVVNYPLLALNGSLLLMLSQEEIPGLQQFIYSASPSKFPRDPITASLWNYAFGPLNSKRNTSNINDMLKIYDTSVLNFNTYRLTYNIYISVYALGHALHDMFMDKVINRQGFPEFMPWKLNSYLKKVHLKTTSVDNMFFNKYGEAPRRLDVLSLNIFPNNTMITRKVGDFDLSAHKENFIIYKERILWTPHFNGIPHSACSKNCPPGSRKMLIKEMPSCCYNCVRCSEGEVTTVSDMENCIRCPKIQWSNEQRNKCIMRTLDFLSFEDYMGLFLTSMAIVLSILTTAILIIFIKYKHTTIVKANNRELSYCLLISLILSFFCSLLFIGWPTKGICLIRQVVFAIDFTFSISCVLGKTLTVVIAFSATRPGSKLRGWVGTRIPKCIVLICTLVEIVICSLWLINSPPFPEYDTESHTATMILHCNEGSTVAFYMVIGYIALLALICLFVAYLSRTLPDIYNEAQYITFSMLVFCSVWISFIPAYLSTKGKFLTSVEIFAILTSGSGLLGLIFVPKCYIILLKPERNTRLYLIQLKHK
ncbi:hypothetical protein XELAEV_18040240mg [Xenopus laevis]|uniref:G-protein coupled receptors family 3 profile domain-containing protein n=1 Tax=Xenopus laevis TaxID=8355 RepID=A0A974C9D2_XENLA|nr:hypothetical protein XELAEV_18040240mg [Xenopus laevis]